MSFIEIKDVKKSFGSNLVLKGLNLDMKKGSLNTLLGSSGCGKSTLLRAIAGLNDIDSGEIYINKVRVDDKIPSERNIGMVFQNYALFPNMTVEENIKFGLEMKKMDKKLQDEKARKMIDLVGLSGKEKEFPKTLSGGQQQRVALARSLVTEPSVLLLDEPLSALDAQIRNTLRLLIKNLQRELGITIIFVTHDQEEAMTMSDYIYIMNNGDIIQEGTPSDIYRNPQNEFVARFIGSYNVYEKEKFEEIDNNLEIKSKFVAIRPETISLVPIENSVNVKGKIINISMLGSLLRFDIELNNGCRISVDRLNRSANFRGINEEINLFIPYDSIIEVN
ncbi:ABC transporter ATP-binding protein [Peptoniphilus rhinitidis]|uniref:ABC transporter ATP-binding protein n=1 Tax=Peptoniphilus rhinitidis TaxID=1175452 RepID=UPI0002883631|nr:ABC transporter ATP-binding protein [Peptoniphilus rhinitidis]